MAAACGDSTSTSSFDLEMIDDEVSSEQIEAADTDAPAAAGGESWPPPWWGRHGESAEGKRKRSQRAEQMRKRRRMRAGQERARKSREEQLRKKKVERLELVWSKIQSGDVHWLTSKEGLRVSDCQLRDEDGSNLLHIAAERGLVDVLAVVVNRGERFRWLVTQKDEAGYTPPQIAHRRRHMLCTQLLLRTRDRIRLGIGGEEQERGSSEDAEYSMEDVEAVVQPPTAPAAAAVAAAAAAAAATTVTTAVAPAGGAPAAAAAAAAADGSTPPAAGGDSPIPAAVAAASPAAPEPLSPPAPAAEPDQRAGSASPAPSMEEAPAPCVPEVPGKPEEAVPQEEVHKPPITTFDPYGPTADGYYCMEGGEDDYGMLPDEITAEEYGRKHHRQLAKEQEDREELQMAIEAARKAQEEERRNQYFSRRNARDEGKPLNAEDAMADAIFQEEGGGAEDQLASQNAEKREQFRKQVPQVITIASMPWPALLPSGRLPLPTMAQENKGQRHKHLTRLLSFWHPDKINQRYADRMAPGDRDIILRRVKEVAQQLNDLKDTQFDF
eukprot:TRINITY_DN14915_c1_g1_i1.p2 TRINITY_DN14915_c1_g1~~TRINITY_DN14915_c1_g1_i1.p2  ORF type:complete len:554 (+),score=218.88 TRINITY_DN14915_c1_g1_i1:84-1745(+)